MASAQKHVDVLILGAGPTGLGAARRLEATNQKSWLMIDALDRPGGMAITEQDSKGFLWDLGGHVIHSHFDLFNDAIGCHNDWVQPSRGGWVRVQNAWCPTPIQRHLGNLADGRQMCNEINEIQSASTSSKPASPSNLDEFYKGTFGKTLDQVFFSPFNFKQWAWPLTNLNHTWTSLRAGSKAPNVPAPNATLESSDRPADTSSFPYPRLGTGSLWQSVAQRLPAERQLYSTSVVSIDLDAHTVKLNSGETISYGYCISSLPLNQTIDLVNAETPCADVPKGLATELKHSATSIIGLGFEGSLPKALQGRSWVFNADPDVPFHRATILTNFSSAMSDGNNAPGSRWSIMFETATSPHRTINTDPEDLSRRILAELVRWGAIVEGQKPISIWHKHLVLGYPIPFLARDKVLLGDDQAGILQRFEQHGFLPRGRFGGWRYESSNQDYAFVQGAEAVDLLLNGTRETVYWPDRQDKVIVLPVPDFVAARTVAPSDAERNLQPSSSLNASTSPVMIRAS